MSQTNAIWPPGSGEMADRIRGHDWAATPLGPVSGWSDRLKVTVEHTLANPLVASLVCGPERLLIYNDAAARLYGDKHPVALGRPLPDTFAEGWAAVAPSYARAFAGETVQVAGLSVDTRGEGLATDVFDAILIPVREANGRPAYVYATSAEVGERLRAERSSRDSEKRQAFLLKLSDVLRGQSNAASIAESGLSMLCEHLRLDRCYIGVYLSADDRADLPYQVGNDRVPPLPPSIRLSAFPNALQIAVEGTLVIDDFEQTAGLSDDDRRNIGALGLRALVAATLRKGEDHPLWTTVAVCSRIRHWTHGEIAALEEAAERIWAAMDRSSRETALRDSQERFRQFAASSSDALWIRDASTLMMEYASPAIEEIYGVPTEAILGGIERWAALIVPEDRAGALAHIQAARQGRAAVHEFRIQRPSDGSFRWIRNTDFPLHDEHGRVQRIGGIAHDATDAKLATEHSAVLLAELQHRVRNIMAVIGAITARTGERAGSVPEYAGLMAGRLMTLARVQTLLTRGANVGVPLRGIVQDELVAQAQHERQYVLEGPDLILRPKPAEVLTLAVHELTTNALKYGALSVPDGCVRVAWSTFERREVPWLSFDWVEEGAPVRLASDPPAPRRRGFGSELIEDRIPYELRGQGTVTIGPGGARCHLEFPLRNGASILETGAPQRAAVFGGALDMSNAEDLTGQTILVVEDDYYLATDTARALRGAGAEVLGPCGSEEAAENELAQASPTGAVLDINLGHGPSFDLAHRLRERGVPFVFITGYEETMIPVEFEGVARMQKPVGFKEVVRMIATLNAPNTGDTA